MLGATFMAAEDSADLRQLLALVRAAGAACADRRGAAGGERAVRGRVQARAARSPRHAPPSRSTTSSAPTSAFPTPTASPSRSAASARVASRPSSSPRRARGCASSGSYAYNSSELTEFSELVIIGVDPFSFEPIFGVIDRSGNSPAFAPEHIFNAWVSQDDRRRAHRRRRRTVCQRPVHRRGQRLRARQRT